MRSILKASLLMSLLAAGLVGQDTAQKPPVTASPNPTSPEKIRVRVELVNVLMTVTDKKNRMVLDLTKDDFRLFEDGKPQSIRFFTRESDLPLRIGLLVDTSNSIRDRLRFEQEAAIDFL